LVLVGLVGLVRDDEAVEEQEEEEEEERAGSDA